MDTETSKVMFALLRSAVCGDLLSSEEISLYSPDILPKITLLAQKHDVIHLIVFALKKNGLFDEGNKNLESKILLAVYRLEKLNYELTKLCAALEQAEIPFIPLKGSVLRQYYPEPWMRTSCDIDVLVHEEDLQRVVSYLSDNLGYRRESQNSHDISMFSQGGVHIEVHFDLVEDGKVNSATAVLKKIWNVAVKHDMCNCQYEIPDEMFYFYHIAHMAKHFESGGCGIRPFLDIWVLTHRVPHDRDKREMLLADGGLSAFAKHAEHLSDVWFGIGTHDDTTRRLEQFIVRGGVYGTQDNRISIQQVRLGGKQGYLRSRVWLSYEKMKRHYPSLDGKPALLPLYEVYRWGRLLFCGGVERSVNELRVSSGISEERSEAARLLLSELGLREHGST